MVDSQLEAIHRRRENHLMHKPQRARPKKAERHLNLRKNQTLPNLQKPRKQKIQNIAKTEIEVTENQT
jgi:hypothetical protein